MDYRELFFRHPSDRISIYGYLTRSKSSNILMDTSIDEIPNKSLVRGGIEISKNIYLYPNSIYIYGKLIEEKLTGVSASFEENSRMKDGQRYLIRLNRSNFSKIKYCGKEISSSDISSNPKVDVLMLNHYLSRWNLRCTRNSTQRDFKFIQGNIQVPNEWGRNNLLLPKSASFKSNWIESWFENDHSDWIAPEEIPWRNGSERIIAVNLCGARSYSGTHIDEGIPDGMKDLSERSNASVIVLTNRVVQWPSVRSSNMSCYLYDDLEKYIMKTASWQTPHYKDRSLVGFSDLDRNYLDLSGLTKIEEGVIKWEFDQQTQKSAERHIGIQDNERILYLLEKPMKTTDNRLPVIVESFGSYYKGSLGDLKRINPLFNEIIKPIYFKNIYTKIGSRKRTTAAVMEENELR